MNAFVIKGDLCYSESRDALHTIEDGYLVCENGVSAGVFRQLPERYRGLPLADHSGRLVIPGLVDLHVHGPQYAFRGLGMDLELLDWLEAHAFAEEARFAELKYAEAAYRRFVEDLVRGPGTRACVFATLHLPATHLLMDLLEQSGLVTLVGKVNMDRLGSDNLREQSAQASLADTAAWLERCAGRYKNTGPILTPRFLPSCSDELLAGLRAMREQYHLPVQSHLSENKQEVADVLARYPDCKTYGHAYDRFGLFGGDGPAVMAHCVWSDGEERRLMKENGVFVAHCPQSNINLASGIAPVRTMLEEGLKVGLGSDVAGGCHTSILRAMADAVSVSKLYWRLVDLDAKPLTVPEAFYLGTLGGGEFFGKVGSFAPGYELDAVVLDDAGCGALERDSVESRLARAVYLSDDRHILAKYVRGCPVHGGQAVYK